MKLKWPFLALNCGYGGLLFGDISPPPHFPWVQAGGTFEATSSLSLLLWSACGAVTVWSSTKWVGVGTWSNWNLENILIDLNWSFAWFNVWSWHVPVYDDRLPKRTFRLEVQEKVFRNVSGRDFEWISDAASCVNLHATWSQIILFDTLIHAFVSISEDQ